MIATQDSIDLIKSQEGFKTKAYKCPAGLWTIGYGHTRGVKLGDRITEEKASELLYFEINDRFAHELDELGLQLNQNQFNALISFVYNIGITKFLKSKLYAAIKENPNNEIRIKKLWNQWTYAGGKKLNGLVNRRKLELELYFKK
ncbi:MAG: lysozyme [Lutibacter sp.]|jgi:lysozyme